MRLADHALHPGNVVDHRGDGAEPGTDRGSQPESSVRAHPCSLEINRTASASSAWFAIFADQAQPPEASAPRSAAISGKLASIEPRPGHVHNKPQLDGLMTIAAQRMYA
ncbi:hypothetical protein KRMM14A1259_57300 [Krasilnikovia sp. MM14-A1259]